MIITCNNGLAPEILMHTPEGSIPTAAMFLSRMVRCMDSSRTPPWGVHML